MQPSRFPLDDQRVYDAYIAGRQSADAAAYLTRGTPGSLWGLVDMEVDGFLSPNALLDALKKDDASVYGDLDPWEAHGQDPERARAFTAAMHSVSERPVAGFAEHLDLSSDSRLLDVGGGSGAIQALRSSAGPTSP